MIAKFLLAAALAAAATAAAAAATAADAAPTWLDGPTTRDVAAVFPPRARAEKVGGYAVLSCAVKRDGYLRDCTTVAVSKLGYNFDVAARQVAGKIRVAPDPTMHPGDELQVRIAFPAAVLDSDHPQVEAPAWSALPSAQDFQATFPKTENGVNDVRVTLDCAVVAGGALDDCRVASETPPGEGYGQGALPLAAKFKVALLTPQGAPTVGGRVRVPIHYKLTQVAAAAR